MFQTDIIFAALTIDPQSTCFFVRKFLGEEILHLHLNNLCPEEYSAFLWTLDDFQTIYLMAKECLYQRSHNTG
jgi:hypothetical protein